MKVVIIGGIAGGASTAARLRRLDEKAGIIILERGKHVSFANCGLPYYCGEVIKDREKLIIQSPQAFNDLLNIEARIESEVVAINRELKTLTVLNKANRKQYEESYDKLVLSPGAYPLKPSLPGIEDRRIFTLRTLEDADAISVHIKKNGIKKAAVIGAGFIGLEMAENLSRLGIEVAIVEMSAQGMNQLDYEMASHVHNHLRTKGIKLYLGDGVKAFTSGKTLSLLLHSGKELEVEMVILSVGVAPETSLMRKAGLAITKSGGILVDEHLRTSDQHIYALGDAIEVKDSISGEPGLIPLAGLAHKQGRIIAENLCGFNSKYNSALGTAIVKIFDLTVASAGNSEKQLIKRKIPYLKSYTHGFSHANYYPEAFPLSIKLLFAPDTGKILGAQIIGFEGVDKRIDILAAMMKTHASIRDLITLELAYAPPFASAKDPVNIAGMAAENILSGKVKPVFWDEIEILNQDPAKNFLLDVRSREEQIQGRLNNSTNIPLEELRSRLEEIPKDKKIIAYCAKGMKSYFAARILSQNGFHKVFSLSGGFSLYQQVQLDKADVGVSNPVTVKCDTASSMVLEIDACGMQCPGPVMKLAEAIGKIKLNECLEIKTTDPGFKKDVQAWCLSSGNLLLDINEENRTIKAKIRKGGFPVESRPAHKNSKTLIVFSNDLDRAMAAFIIANGAAAVGKPVTLFFTFWGLTLLKKPAPPKNRKGILDWMFGIMTPKGPEQLALSKLHMSGLGTYLMKLVMKRKNVASLNELMLQAQTQGVRFIACQMSMDVMGIKPEELIPGVEIAGVASYLNAAEHSDLNLFI